MSNITLRRAAEQMLECLLYHYNAGNSNTITGVRLKLDEKAIREARAALAEPEQNVLRRDAERYRWLRGEVQGPHTPLAQVVWKRNNIRESGDWTNLSDGQALDAAIDAAIDAALAEPEQKPEPATGEQMFAAYNAQASGPQKSTIAFYCDGWRAAERFHNITKEDKT